jgi:multidrug efflux pump subunit AcrA (membrane-fusion protein)
MSLSGGCGQRDFDLSATRESRVKRVNVIQVQRVENLPQTRIFFGTLEPEQERQLGFGQAGTIQSIEEVAGLVASGEVLARLDQSELERRKAELEALLQARGPESVGANPLRGEELRSELRQVNADLSRGQIVAPFDCVVLDVFAVRGSLASPQSPVLHVAADASPKIRASLPRRIATRLTTDQLLRATLGEQSVDCRLAKRLLSESPGGSTTVWFEMVSALAAGSWSFGQGVEIQLTLPSPHSGFWLPLSALIRDSDGLWSVYATQGTNGDARNPWGQLVRKTVEVVQLLEDGALVRGALTESDFIVVDGQHRIVSGQMVRVNRVVDRYPPPPSLGVAD